MGADSGEDPYCRVGEKRLQCLPACGECYLLLERSGPPLHALIVQSLGSQNIQVSQFHVSGSSFSQPGS